MAILMKQLHFPVWPTIAAGLVVVCGIGFLNGFMVSPMSSGAGQRVPSAPGSRAPRSG